MSICFRAIVAAAIVAMVVFAAGSAEAGWGRYRVSTYYGTPSVPVVQETVVERGVYRPVLVAPAPLVVAPAVVAQPAFSYSGPAIVSQGPVTAYYAPPAVYAPAPRAVRATYFAPAPVYVAPVPGVYYDRGFPRVILP